MENRTISRRDAFKAIGGLAFIAGGASASCGGGTPESLPTTEAVLDPKGILVREILSLPDSSVKTLLSQRVVPYFQQPTPHVSRIESFDLPVHSSNVTVNHTDNKNISGTYNGRGGSPPSEFRLITPITIPVPLPNAITGTASAIFPVEFKTTESVYEGVAPLITVSRPHESIVPQQEKKLLDTVTKAVLLKESSSFLVENILLEEVNRKMELAGIPTSVMARELSSGSEKAINIVPQIVNKISARKGRWVNGVDATGILVSLKAMRQEDLSLLRAYGTYRPIIDSLSSISLSGNPEEFIDDVMKWYLQYPNINSLQIIGNRDLIP